MARIKPAAPDIETQLDNMQDQLKVNKEHQASPDYWNAYHEPGNFKKKFEVTHGMITVMVYEHDNKLSLNIGRRHKTNERLSYGLGVVEIYSTSGKKRRKMVKDIAQALQMVNAFTDHGEVSNVACE